MSLGLWLGSLLLPVSAVGQEAITVAGTVLRIVPADSVPLPGVRVVLHQVGRNLQGPIDSSSTDPTGRFVFSFAPDTTAVYILSARHFGIEYFSTPVHTNPERRDTAIVLVVSDTSSDALIEVVSRQVVIGSPRSDGSRDVVDLITLENRTTETRVPGVSQQPTWLMPLDPSVVGFDVGASDFSPEAVFQRDGMIEVFGPIPPGSKDLLLRYLIPSGAEHWPIAVGDTVRDLSIMIEDGALRVIGPAMEAPAPQVIGGRSFSTWRSRPTPGDTITIVFHAGPPVGGTLALVALVGLMVVALGVTGFAWYRRTAAHQVAVTEEPMEVLVRKLATLDARYQGRQGEVPPSEWLDYQARRKILKEQFERVLATSRSLRGRGG